MREVTKQMIHDYCLMKLKYDFMGYQIDRKEDLSFHHTILSYRECIKKGLGSGYWHWNGSLLVQDTAHEYLHKIELYDFERFSIINSEMIDENVKGHLDMDNLRKINDILLSFENEYLGRTTSRGNQIIKPEYVEKRVLKRKF